MIPHQMPKKLEENVLFKELNNFFPSVAYNCGIFPRYERFTQDLNNKYPGLVWEYNIDLKDPEKTSMGYYYGYPSHMDVGYYEGVTNRRHEIHIAVNHKDSHNEDRLVTTLAHEFGHFYSRTFFPFRLLYLSKKTTNKNSFINYKFWVIVDEFLAWIIGLTYLYCKYKDFKILYLQIAYSCFNSYCNVKSLIIYALHIFNLILFAHTIIINDFQSLSATLFCSCAFAACCLMCSYVWYRVRIAFWD